MFKNLKKKVGDGLATVSPAAAAAARGLMAGGASQQRQRGSTDTTPSGTPSGSLLDLRSPPTTFTDSAAPAGFVPRSRTSSISSQFSEVSFAGGGAPPVTSPGGGAGFEFDGSVSEVETEDGVSGTSATAMNKDDLYRMYCKVQRRGLLYKTKLSQVLAAYKEVDKDREKLKATLTQSQDKALRRISELKEQLALEAGAKRDVENNYTLMLEEREELITVLRTQVKLLKDGKTVPEELLVRSGEKPPGGPGGEIAPPTEAPQAGISGEEAAALKDKVRRLETLLNKCKETITANKERTQQVSADREGISRQLEARTEELDKLKDQHKESTDKFRAQLSEARRLLKDLEADKAASVEASRRDFQTTLEVKDARVATLEQELDEMRRVISQHGGSENLAPGRVDSATVNSATVNSAAVSVAAADLIAANAATVAALEEERGRTTELLRRGAEERRELERRVSDLIDRENQLNTELEQTKVDNEARLAAQQTEMTSLRALIGQLQSSEQMLTDQMEATNTRCGEQLSRASQQNEQAMAEFSTLLQSSQSQMVEMLGELESTRQRSNEIADSLERQLDERTAQLEEAYRRIDELGGAGHGAGDTTAYAALTNGDDQPRLSPEKSADRPMGELLKQLAETEAARRVLAERLAAFESAMVPTPDARASAERVEALERERAELRACLAKQSEEQASARSSLEQEHAAKVKELMERLASEEANMYQFRDSVKRQFEERHLKVRAVIESVQEGCERSLQDRDEVHEIKLKNFEREKNREKEKAVEELTNTITTLTAELETLRQRLNPSSDENSNEEPVQAEGNKLLESESKKLIFAPISGSEQIDGSEKDQVSLSESPLVFATASDLEVEKSSKHIDQSVALDPNQLAAEMEQLRFDLVQSQRSLALSEATLSDTRSELEKSCTSLEQTKAELECTERSGAESSEQLNFLTAEVESAKVRLREAGAQHQSERESLLKHLEADKGEMMRRLADLEADRGGLVRRLAEAEAEKEKVEEKNVELMKMKGELEACRIEMEKRVDELKADKAEIEGSREEMLGRFRQLEEEKVRFEGNQEEMTKKIENLEAEKGSLATQINGLESVKGELTRQQGVLEENRLELTKRLELLESERNEHERNKVELTEKLSTLVASKEELEESKNELIKKLGDQETEKDELEKNKADALMRLMDLEGEKTKLVNRQSELESQNFEQEKHCDDLQAQNDDLTRRIGDLDVEAEAAMKRESVLRGELARLETEAVDAVKRVRAAENESQALVEEQLQRRADDELKREGLSAIDTELQRMRDECERMRSGRDEELAEAGKWKAELERVGEDLERVRESEQRSASELMRTEAELKQTKIDLDRATEAMQQFEINLAQYRADLEQSKTTASQTAAELERAKYELDAFKAGQDRKELEPENSALLAEQMSVKLEAAKAELGQARMDGEKWRLSHEQMLTELEKTKADLERAKFDLEQALGDVSKAVAASKLATAELSTIKEELLNKTASTVLSVSGNSLDRKGSVENERRDSFNSVEVSQQPDDPENQDTVTYSGLSSSFTATERTEFRPLHKENRTTLNAQLAVEVEKLRAENLSLSAELKRLRKPKALGSVGDFGEEGEWGAGLGAGWEAESARMRAEFESAIKRGEEEHESKVMHLAKELRAQMTAREQQIAESFGRDTESSDERVARLVADHKQELTELHQLLDERDSQTEQLVLNYEKQIKMSETQNRSHVERLNSIVEDLQQRLLDLEHDLEVTRRSAADKDLATRAGLDELEGRMASSMTTSAVPLRGGFHGDGGLGGEEGGQRRRDDVQSLGSEDAFQLLELQNVNLQAEVNKQLGENAKAKIRERELLHEIERLRSAGNQMGGLNSHYYSGGGHSGPLLTEPTELEYLRNILYKYMTGLETKTLARVICTVVKFSEDQTRQILDKEDARSSIFSPTHR